MKNINVGILTSHHFPRLGGMEYVNHYLASALSKLPMVNVSVACSTMPEVDHTFIYPYPCYRSKSFSILTSWLEWRNRIKMISKEKINILHGAMLHGGGWFALQIKRNFSLPFVAQSHGSDVQVVPQIKYGALLLPEYKEKILKVIKNADHLIAISNLNREKIINLGADPSKVSVINNGILFNKIQKIPFKDMRKIYSISPEDFLIISVGRNRPVKRLNLLFEALQKLRDYKDIKCICVGPKQDLYYLAMKFNVLEKVILTGKIPDNYINSDPPFFDLINHYRAANVYISCSYFEAFSGAALDALACGLPIIIGSKHGVKEVIELGKTGLAMENDNADELAELIISVYEKKDTWVKMNNYIKETVSHLTWENTAKNMLNIYKMYLE